MAVDRSSRNFNAQVSGWNLVQTGQQSRADLRTLQGKTVRFHPAEQRKDANMEVVLVSGGTLPPPTVSRASAAVKAARRVDSRLAPGSCCACSRQLAPAVGRKPPGGCTRSADSLPSLRWSSRHSLAVPRQRTNPTKEVPNAAEPSRLQMIGVLSGSLGHSLPPPSSLRLPATILGNWPVTSRAS